MKNLTRTPYRIERTAHVLTVRGTSTSLHPYAIEIVGATAPDWERVLTGLRFRRKSMGVQPKPVR